ncbi:MAG: 50S ribosomal protein L11 [Thermoplasmata archaeon]|nr:50S ribosomal protein L11 [Thermoplasmata archaeon]
MAETIEALVDAGNATAGPPLGPALGPFGINIMDVIKVINERTQAFQGLKIPVKVIVDPETREFEIEIGTPPTTALILKELGVEKGPGKVRVEKIGDLSVEQLKKIVETKGNALLGKTKASACKEVLGTCLSMGVTVDGKDPREVQKLIDEGKLTI